MTDTQTLHTLYELHIRSVNAGGGGFFPEEICSYRGIWLYANPTGGANMKPAYMLDIVNAHAERWLMESHCGWMIQKSEGQSSYEFIDETPNGTHDYGPVFETGNITDAIRYEVERMEKEQETK